MTGEKIKEVATKYARVIHRMVEIHPARILVPGEPMRGPVDKSWTTWSPAEQANHLLFACAEMKRFVDEGRLEKSFRWLGWIQGTLTALGVYTIEDCGNHNRPDPPEEAADADTRAAGRLAVNLGRSS